MSAGAALVLLGLGYRRVAGGLGLAVSLIGIATLLEHASGLSLGVDITNWSPSTAIIFRWKDYAHGDQRRMMTLSAMEFLRRFVQHILPRGFVRIRQSGFLANTCRTARVALARTLLARPAPVTSSTPTPAMTTAAADTVAVWACPRCGAAIIVGPILSALHLASVRLGFDTSLPIRARVTTGVLVDVVAHVSGVVCPNPWQQRRQAVATPHARATGWRRRRPRANGRLSNDRSRAGIPLRSP